MILLIAALTGIATLIFLSFRKLKPVRVRK